jgi:hypothetical protein
MKSGTSIKSIVLNTGYDNKPTEGVATITFLGPQREKTNLTFYP